MKKVRVLEVIGKLAIGGAENVAANIIRNIDRDKYEISYLVYTKEIGEYEQEISDLGGKIVRVDYDSNILSFYKKIKKKMKETGPYDIVHAHMMFHNAIVLKAAKAAKIGGRISHSHSTKVGNIKLTHIIELLYSRIARRMINFYSTDYLACGVEAGEFLYGKDRFNKKGIVIDNGIDLNKFQFDPQKREKMRELYNLEGKYIISNAARFTEEKNHAFLIDVFNEVVKEKPNAVLLLMGDGILREKIEKLVKKLKLEQSVMFLGNVSNVNEIFQMSDVYVMPSLYEGLPVALLEAQASGLHCVVSDRITKEANVSNNVRYLSLDSNIKEWVKEILCFENVDRAGINKTMREKGYDVCDCIKKLERIYEQCIMNEKQQN